MKNTALKNLAIVTWSRAEMVAVGTLLVTYGYTTHNKMTIEEYVDHYSDYRYGIGLNDKGRIVLFNENLSTPCITLAEFVKLQTFRSVRVKLRNVIPIYATVNKTDVVIENNVFTHEAILRLAKAVTKVKQLTKE